MLYLSLTFLANYSEFPNSCRSLQFFLQPNLSRNRNIGGLVNDNGTLQFVFGLLDHDFPVPSFFLEDGK